MANPPIRGTAAAVTHHGAGADTVAATATSSAASSQVVGPSGSASASTGSSRSDQILYRFYLKSVGVLVDSRVTHYGAQRGERKKDRWFNITTPDTDVHKSDLRIYRSLSSYAPQDGQPTVPPLLVAFILDTNDIPAGQTLLWNRGGARVALDPTLVKPPLAGGRRPGIVLERWTLRVSDQTSSPLSESEMAPPTAYRLGIIHFRALYAFIRLLPAYRLYRRLRRLNTGLRLGIKLWGPEGYKGATGLAEAWEVIERDLIGIDIPLEQMILGVSEESPSAICERYEFPPLELFGSIFEQSVLYRPNIDFEVEDKESVLSERFVDMEEEWFTPTVARHRLAAEARASASGSAGTSGSYGGSRPPTAEPQQQQSGVSALGSSLRNMNMTGTPGTSGRATATPSGGSSKPSSLGAGKWGALAENLPFAVGGQSATPPSPTVATPGTNPISYRRLSAHSLQPFRSISASPSTSILRMASGVTTTPTPSSGQGSQTGRAIPTAVGSTGRTSSFLSQSGRSFSHAQLANMHGASASPPISGGLGASPPLNFSKQALPGSLGRAHAPHMMHSTSSPFVPSSSPMERDSSLPGGSPSQLTKRHSSNFAPRRSTLGSPDLPAATLMRRTSTRESGLRHSVDEPRPADKDNDDVHAFLRALDSWTPPPSLQAKPSPRAAPAPLASSATPGGSDDSPATAGSVSSAGASIRAPLTRAHVDDMLKRMAGTFSPAPPSGARTPASLASASVSASRRDSAGSESISSPPSGVPIRPMRPGFPPNTSLSPSPYGTPGSNLSPGTHGAHGLQGQGSIPRGSPGSHARSTPGALRGSPARASFRPLASLDITPEEPAAPAARSLPDAQPGLTPLAPASMLSPQTTGGLGQRRPVLVRGGFGPASSKASSSSSPSHSPVRYRSGLHAERERSEQRGERERERERARRHYREGSAPGLIRARRTAPSSLSAEGDENLRLARGRVASEGSGSPLGAAERDSLEHELATGSMRGSRA